MRHNSTLPLAVPAAKVSPSGLNATEKICPSWWLRVVCREEVVAVSHNLTLPSSLPTATVLPCGLNATEETGLPCLTPIRPAAPLRAVIRSRRRRLHSRILPSVPPVTRVLPFGLNATDLGGPMR